MTIAEDIPSVGERYSSAVRSSNLRVKLEARGDVDMMIAAGCVPDGLGATLYRLAVEFDTVRNELRDAKGLNQTERYLILSRMRTLRPAKEEIHAWAVVEATRQRFMQPDSVVAQIVARVIDAHLDPKCHHCEGRGFVGGGRHEHTGPQIICRACRGTGSRRDSIGKTREEIAFAAHLLAELGERMRSVETMMRRYLHTR